MAFKRKAPRLKDRNKTRRKKAATKKKFEKRRLRQSSGERKYSR
ncbi:hypothetical protein ACFL27_11620 [candidate division CSSED10-310 bacterium]|uniref:30S ribosomal protein S21 n=1 Tax=candidate division CSSED10-310 bacterium TaxID=2855610 RepID=A0ABV6YXB4_UNCC1